MACGSFVQSVLMTSQSCQPEFSADALQVLAMDMDSTLINIECIDEIADFAGD